MLQRYGASWHSQVLLDRYGRYHFWCIFIKWTLRRSISGLRSELWLCCWVILPVFAHSSLPPSPTVPNKCSQITAHPIQVAWNSRNSNAVRSRTVSAALYNMFVQASGIISSNIYRADDAPRYKRGDRVLVILCVSNMGVYILTKIYYVWRNSSRDKIWNAMSEDERLDYLATTKDEGNKRLDFRFAH